jgi:RNA polymerase sigma factor (TIGR02999 family)
MTGDTDSREISRLLQAAGAGQPVDTDALLPLVYDQLRKIAARRMAGERPGHTLQATALVHEACVKLLGNDGLTWRSKSHFFAAAAEAMRRILVDHARARRAEKRGRGRRGLPLSVVDLADHADFEEIVAIDEVVSRLEKRDGELAEVVRLRFYAGLEEREVAQALGRGARTVSRQWALARAWLQRELSGD